MTSSGKESQKRVDIVIVGGGPATLALLCNASKTGR
jgi:NADPH-dependent 2,4-dienoyl-CoA reductase/sulfur reductase-like enzyme